MTLEEQLEYYVGCLKRVFEEGPGQPSYLENVFYMTGLVRSHIEKLLPEWCEAGGVACCTEKMQTKFYERVDALRSVIGH